MNGKRLELGEKDNKKFSGLIIRLIALIEAKNSS